MAYDSAKDVQEHILAVKQNLSWIIWLLSQRGLEHDSSKLMDEEKYIFDEYTPKLQEVEYGSDEYDQALLEMQPALDHHYTNNRHHPEFHENGVDGMTLIDIVEMLCDWKAANSKKGTMDFIKSIALNQHRFDMSDQLTQILINTAKELGW